MAYVFSHLHRHTGVIESDHRNVVRYAQLHQRVHTSANIEDASKRRLLIKKLLRRRPDYRVICRRCARRP